MPTDKQLEASRLNGAKSRGPVTPEGKRNSSRNSVRHGLLARTVVLDGESLKRFNRLLDALVGELLPETPIESLYVEKMAVAQWRQERIWSLDKASMSHERRQQDSTLTGDDPATRDALAFRTLSEPPRPAALMNLCEMRFDRQFSRNMDAFERCRTARKTKIEANEPSK